MAESRVELDTAAGHATRHVPTAAPGDLAGRVREGLAGRSFECATHVVICEGETFSGLVRIERLFSAQPDAPMSALMDTDAPVSAPGMDQEVAAGRAMRQDAGALVVVDEARRFAGLIPARRLAAVLAAEHEEDLARIAGFLHRAADARLTTEEPVHRRFLHRLPWLALGLAGALFAADLVGHFETALEQSVMLAFFIPGIVYIADAVGTQTETIVIRGLSLGIPMRQMIWRELLTGMAVGLALAAITAPLVWLHWRDNALALSVSLSMLATCSTATVAAMVMPWMFDRIGIDPAFGSGPVATVIQDLLSIWIYLLVATSGIR